jgi:hypothetical protein
VIVIVVGISPSRFATASTTQRNSFDVSSSAECGAPPSKIGAGSPIRRLNCRATRSGSVSTRRSAASPISTDPSGPT